MNTLRGGAPGHLSVRALYFYFLLHKLLRTHGRPHSSIQGLDRTLRRQPHLRSSPEAIRTIAHRAGIWTRTRGVADPRVCLATTVTKPARRTWRPRMRGSPSSPATPATPSLLTRTPEDQHVL